MSPNEFGGEAADADRSLAGAQSDPDGVERTAEDDRLGGAGTASDRTANPSASRIALGFVLLGAVSVAGAVVVTDGREVLFALAGIGLFGGLLTYSLAGDRFVSAGDGERVYAACAGNLSRLLSRFDSTAEPIYVPVDGDDAETVRLFVPAAGKQPDESIGDPDRDGMLLEPTGLEFVREIEGPLSAAADAPDRAAEPLTDALVDRFELVSDASVVETDGRDVTVAVSDSAFGAVDRFDHPVASILAVGLAVRFERPIAAEVDAAGETDRGDWLVTCRWVGKPTADASAEPDAAGADADGESLNA